MTKYRTYTNEELLRQWDSLEPLYLLEEARLRMTALVDQETEALKELWEEVAILERELKEAQEEIERVEDENANLRAELDEVMLED